MKTKINFRPSRSRKAKRRIGCLDPKTGKIVVANSSKTYDIDKVEKYDVVSYFETYENGVLVQKRGRFEG